MSVSLYRLTIPVYERGFGVLSQYLDKAAAFAREQGIDPDSLVNARLAPDMLPLAGQIQRASDTSKNAIVRLTGIEAPRFDDNETTLAQLQQRIDNTLAFISTVTPAQLEGSEAREVTLTFPTVKATLSGDEFLLTFGLPNFFFHIATAHAILRQQGVPIGKTDYLGPFT